MTKEIGQQYQYISTRGQLQGFLLMRRIAPAYMVPNGYIVALQNLWNVPQTICSDNNGT